jgi:hypothetical protein
MKLALAMGMRPRCSSTNPANISGDGLNHVGEGHQTFRLSVFIHHDGNVYFFFLEPIQKVEDGRAVRNIYRRSDHLG